MKFKNIVLVSMVAIPLTFLEVSAAGNTDKLKDTIIDKTIQKFEDGFNTLFTTAKLKSGSKLYSFSKFSLSKQHLSLYEYFKVLKARTVSLNFEKFPLNKYLKLS